MLKTLAPVEAGPTLVSKRCFEAAEKAAQCAAHCLSTPADHDTDDCAQACLVASRVLGACADLLPWIDGPRLPVMAAMASAGIVAAEECVAATSKHAGDISWCGHAAAASQSAAEQLRGWLADAS
jgi:hypothetical protein